jgi:PAS domain S-box-containing protein
LKKIGIILNSETDIDFETTKNFKHSETVSSTKNLNSGISKSKTKIDYVEEAHLLDKKGIIVLSGELNEIGNIINCNDSIYDLFGYLSKDVVGQNVNILMPRQFQYQHNVWIKDYLTRGAHSTIFEHEARQIWVRDKKGFLVECNLDVKIVPDLTSGIKIMGVIYKNDQIGKHQGDEYLETYNYEKK